MKKLIYSLITALLVVILAACGSNGESTQSNDEAPTEQDQKEIQKKLDEQKVDEKKTVAIVNDKEILGIDFNMVLSATQMQLLQMGQDPTADEIADQLKTQTLDNLVGQELLLQVAAQKGYAASDEEVKKQLEDIRKQYQSDQEFDNAMKQNGFDPAKLETEIAENIQITKYVDKEITVAEVTEDEMMNYYNQAVKHAKEGQEFPSFTELKPQIKDQLEQQKKQEEVGKAVERLKKEAEIEYKI